MSLYTDFVSLARRLRWSREHWKHDPTQPVDLDTLLTQAADAMDTAVSKIWLYVALAEAVIVLALIVWIITLVR
jgi:hypothetical protein